MEQLSASSCVGCHQNRRFRRPIGGGGGAFAGVLLVGAATAAGLLLFALHGSALSQRHHQPPPQHHRLLREDFPDSLLAGDGAGQQPSRRQFLASRVTHLQLPGGGDTRADADWLANTRFHPSSFRPASLVLSDTVHCDKPLESELGIFYTEPTWLCKNIRVGQRRLPFTDTTTRTQNELTMYRRRELELSGPDFSNEMCGRLPDRENNVFLLCELLLAQLETRLTAPPVASSVHVPYGNCSLPEHGRAILVGEAAADAVWHTEEKLWPGFVTDLFCSFALR